MKSKREKLEALLKIAQEHGIVPASALIELGEYHTRDLINELVHIPEFWEADKLSGMIPADNLPLFNAKDRGVVPPTEGKRGVVLTETGWEKIPSKTSIIQTMGGGGGGGGGTPGPPGANGAPGPAGPNTITLATTTNLTGLLAGNGATVVVATAGVDYQAPLAFPLAANLGGTGIANLAASTLTLGAATTITGGGTLALGGFTATVQATGIVALGTGGADQVAYWVNANTLTGNGNFTYTPGTGVLYSLVLSSTGLTLSGWTTGSIPFMSGTGYFTEDTDFNFITGTNTLNVPNIVATGSLDVDGHSAFGGNATVTANRVAWFREISTVVNTTTYGIHSDYYWQPSGALGSTSAHFGVLVDAVWNTLVDGSTHANLYGTKSRSLSWLSGSLLLSIGVLGIGEHAGAGTVTTLIGVQGDVQNNDSGGETGDVTGAYSLLASGYTDKTTGVIATRYGLYIQDVTGGGLLTNQYGIYCPALAGASGDNLFIKNISADSDFGSGDITTTGTVVATTVNGLSAAQVTDLTDGGTTILHSHSASTPAAHDILSAQHGDTLAGSVLDGDVIIGNVTPKWSRLAITVPAANVRNVFGVDNTELRPSWKVALDATNPETLTAAGSAAPGTSLVFAHRDHVHAITVSPTLLGNGAMQYQTIVTGAGAFAPAYSGFLLDGTTGGKTVLAVTNSKTLTLTSTDSYNITFVADMTFPANAAGALTNNGAGVLSWAAAGGVAAGTSQYQIYTTSANPFPGGWSDFWIKGTTGGTTVLAVTNAKTLTLTSTGDFNLTVPATGTAALLATANVFTTQQMVDGTSDQIQLRVQGNSTQTTNLQTWESSAGAVLTNVTAEGKLVQNLTLATPTVATYGYDSTIYFQGGAGDISGAQRAFQVNTYLLGTGGATNSLTGLNIGSLNSNTGTVTAVTGINGTARSNSTSGNTTQATAFRGQIGTIGAGTVTQGDSFFAVAPSKTSTGNITTVAGFHASNQGVSGTTTSYGILLDSQSGSTTNYAIYANAGLNRLGDQLSIVGSADRIQLQVKANATQTTNVLSIETSAAAVNISMDNNGGAIFNEQGNSLGDFRIEGDTEVNLAFADYSADTIAFGGTGAAGATVSKGGHLTLPDINFLPSTPTTMSGDVNDYDLGTNTWIRLSGGAADRIVTGIVARNDGHYMIITNIGTTNKISFSNESGSSTAANRIITAVGGTVELHAYESIFLIYDATTARWREVIHA
jgi:hypothetical protein